MDNRSPYEFLLRMLRPGENNPAALSLTDWDGVVEQSLHHGVSGLLLARLKKSNSEHVPAGIVQRLRSISLRTGIENTRLYHELSTVLARLQKEAIPVVVLKGAHLAELVYENISLRAMDDVDLLIQEKDLTRVETLLFNMGYVHREEDARRMKSTTPHHLVPFRKNGCAPIEVHWTLPSMTESDDLWSRAQRVSMGGCDVLVLSTEDLLLHVAIHASLHHRFGLGLRPLCDISATIHRYHDVLNWESVKTRAHRWGVSRSVHLILRLANELVGAAVPDQVLQSMKVDEKLVDWAKEQIHTMDRELAESSSVSPRLAQFWNSGSLTSRTRQLFHVAFPSRNEMARTYGLSPTSGRVYLSYPVHWKDILSLRGGVIWRLLRGDRDTLAKAEMYRKLVDEPRSRG